MSPFGMTHSIANRFSAEWPIKMLSGPGPWNEVAAARGETLAPAPIIWVFKPRFMASA
jgi:hypothetical protein